MTTWFMSRGGPRLQNKGTSPDVKLVFVKGTKEAALSAPTGISFAIPAQYLKALLAGAAAGRNTASSGTLK